MTKERFSKRQGFHQPLETEISIRHNAPYELRGVLIQLVHQIINN